MVYNQLTDADLACRLREHDRAAYSEIYQRYRLVLCHHAFRLTMDENLSADIVQDVFLMLWKDAEKIKPHYPISSFLFACVKNRIIDAIRSNKVRGNHLDKLHIHFSTRSTAPDEVLLEKQLNLQLEHELEKMPEKMRRAFELSRKNQLSYKEISLRTGTTEATIGKQISQVLGILGVKLKFFN